MNIGEYSPRRSRGEYSPIFTSLRRIIGMLLIPGTGNGERGTGNGERGTGNGERGTGNGERGEREWGIGNGEPGTGVWEQVYSGNPLESSKWRSKEKARRETI